MCLSKTQELEYEIIATGSSGNCVIIDDIMIDCGITAKELKSVNLKQVKNVLFTHEHSDHIKKANLNKLLTKNIYVPHSIAKIYEVQLEKGKKVITLESQKVYDIGKYKVVPFPVYHDVYCIGFSLIGKDHSILYATDLALTEDLPDLQYDYIFLEANYDEDKIFKVIDRDPKMKARVKNNFRHLSKQKSIE